MSDNFPEVTTTGWGQPSPQPGRHAVRIILIPASIILLYRNEGRAVEVIRAFDQYAAQLVEVSPDAVDPESRTRHGLDRAAGGARAFASHHHAPAAVRIRTAVSTRRALSLISTSRL
jgi:hypothetical protein